MVQTVSRPNNLKYLNDVDLIIVDEAHHIRSNSYTKIIKKFPKAKLLGVTATPERSDKKGLDKVFHNIVDDITTQLLIGSGYLVEPKGFAITKIDLSKIKKVGNEYNMAHVEKQLNIKVVNDAVLKHWSELASERKTIIFTSTTKHAQSVAETFSNAGIKTGVLDQNISAKDRQEILQKLKHGKIQVLVNVFILTEGFDEPSVDCVVLLRPCSHKSTMVQMIGRGLRLHPNKIDCIVLDFGESIKTHGLIDVDYAIGIRKGKGGKPPYKICLECNHANHTKVVFCKHCGTEFKVSKIEVSFFEMEKVEIEKPKKTFKFDWLQLGAKSFAISSRPIKNAVNNSFSQNFFFIDNGEQVKEIDYDGELDYSFVLNKKNKNYYSPSKNLFYNPIKKKFGTNIYLFYKFDGKQEKIFHHDIQTLKGVAQSIILDKMHYQSARSHYNSDNSAWRSMIPSEKQKEYYKKLHSRITNPKQIVKLPAEPPETLGEIYPLISICKHYIARKNKKQND